MLRLKIQLAGILQSYGTKQSLALAYRDTAFVPTKSAIIGLLACALGIHKENPLYDDISGIEMYARENTYNGVLVDYQIIAPRVYQHAGETAKNVMFQAMNGENNKSQLPTNKVYLQDTDYSVYLLSNDRAFLEKLHHALRHPVWSYYMGRACCTPSRPLVSKTPDITEWNEEEKRLCTYMN